MMTAIARIITATPTATDTTAIRSITPGLFSGEGFAMRRAMKKARFMAAVLQKIYAKKHINFVFRVS